MLTIYSQKSISLDSLARQLIYAPHFDLNELTETDRQRCRQHRVTSGISPWLMVLLNIGTLGVAPMCMQLSQHGALPVLKHDDPSPDKAIGLSLIPFFNWFYWQIFAYLRLVDRINFQFRLRNESPRLSRTFAKWVTISYAVGMIYAPIAWVLVLVLWSIFAAQIQSALNELAQFDQRQLASSELRESARVEVDRGRSALFEQEANELVGHGDREPVRLK